MRLMKLIYQEKNFSVHQVCTSYFTESRVLAVWKKRYGKMFDKCTVEIECDDVVVKDKKKLNPHVRPVRNIRTGDYYYSVNEAVQETGLSYTSVYNQCNRSYSIGYDYWLKWA